MNRRFGACLALLALVSCRDYQYESHMTSQDGLVPPDQFARYGKEQAEAVAIGREYGKAAQGDSPEALTKQADAAMAYARTLPDVATIGADPQGQRAHGQLQERLARGRTSDRGRQERIGDGRTRRTGGPRRQVMARRGARASRPAGMLASAIYRRGRHDERSRMLPGDHDAARARGRRPACRCARRGALGGLRPGGGARGEHLPVAGRGRAGHGVVLPPEDDARPRARPRGAAPRAPSVRHPRDRRGGDRRR